MKLQLALDDMNLEDGINLVGQVKEYIGVVEIGTPMIIRYGMQAVREMRKSFPDILITADAKIMDAGEYEAAICFEAGANIVSVMGYTHDETIEGAVKAAEEYNGYILADMMCVPNIPERALELAALGVDFICVHTAVDVQHCDNPYESLVHLSDALPHEKCCIAGGINKGTIKNITSIKPGIIVVGGAITSAENPPEYAKELFFAMNE